MLIALADAAWRALLLLAIGLAPYAAPVEAVGARTGLVAAMRLGLFAVVVVLLGFAARRCARHHAVVAAFCIALGVALPVSAALFAGDRGPLARGAWLLTPLVWSAIGAALAGPLASRFPATRAPRARVSIALAALAIGAGSLARAAPRIASRSSLWRQALALNPGDVSAALRVSEERRGAHDRRGALEVLLACSRVNPSACKCGETAASDAIDLGRFADARAALEASTGCARTPHRIAVEAETAIGSGFVAEGRRQADVACALDPNEPHAVYARGWATMLAGDAQQARPDAERAVQLSRGEPANVLLGLLLFRAGDLAGAESQFRAALASAPDDARATYDLALVADRRQQFHDAREEYLRALRLDPTMADARVNLAVLTYSRGAVDEAQHHVEELLKIAPNDPRIPSLFQMLSRPPPREAMTLGR